MTYFYARVSSKEQRLDRQIAAAKASIPDLLDECVYCDKQSGKDFERPAYLALVGKLERDDVLVVKSIDRFGRDYAEIKEQWRIITKQIGAHVVVIDMPLLDTRTGRDLTGTLIADIVLELLSYVAETERKNIAQRRQEGIELAKKRGVKFGRPKKELNGFQEIAQKQKDGLLTVGQACAELGISKSQWYRIKKDRCPGQGNSGLAYQAHQ